MEAREEREAKRNPGITELARDVRAVATQLNCFAGSGR